jgi:hypothetical protein
MAYDVAKLKQDLEGIIHGTTLNQITNLNSVIDRAARQILLDVDPQETIRIIDLPNALYNGIYNYPCPTDLKGNKIIDVRPQVSRNFQDVYSQTYNQTFDLTKAYTLAPEFTINFNTGVKSLRLSNPQLLTGIIINPANTIASNGTWSVGGNATSLAQDDVNFATNGSSLSFNLSAGADPSTGYLENSTMSSVDLSAHEDQSNLFLWTYFPTGLDIDSVKLQWGTDSSNYWERTATVTQENAVFQDGWNLLQYQWLGSTETGAPDSSDIQYLRVTWTYNGDLQTSMRLNAISSVLGQIWQIEYYSKYLFRDLSTGAFQETVTDDSNLINLDTETYNLLTYKAAILASQQQAGSEGVFDNSFLTKEYAACLSRYKALYKSQIIKPKDLYYKMPNTNYRRWFGGRL